MHGVLVATTAHRDPVLRVGPADPDTARRAQLNVKATADDEVRMTPTEGSQVELGAGDQAVHGLA